MLHIDDGYVRILEVIGKRCEVLVADAQLTVPERTGLFTTAVVRITQGGSDRPVRKRAAASR